MSYLGTLVILMLPVRKSFREIPEAESKSVSEMASQEPIILSSFEAESKRYRPAGERNC